MKSVLRHLSILILAVFTASLAFSQETLADHEAREARGAQETVDDCRDLYK